MFGMGRLVSAGNLVYDQLDLFSPPTSINRVQGETAAQFTLVIFANNSLISWPIADGTNIPDSAISSGTIYFNEIAGSPGYYAIRFFPDRVGFWRLIFRETAFSVEVIREYDVVASSVFTPGAGSNGLNASFIPQ